MDVMLAVGTLFVGSLLTWGVQSHAYSRERSDRREDERIRQLVELCKEYLGELHEAMYCLIRCSEGFRYPIAGSREDAFARVGESASRAYFELALIAPQSIASAALTARTRLFAFRSAVASGARYESPEYDAPLDLFREARANFIREVRRELGKGRLVMDAEAEGGELDYSSIPALRSHRSETSPQRDDGARSGPTL